MIRSLVFVACLPAVAQELPVLARLRAAAQEAPVGVAHRGASEACPENTLVALRTAVAMKAMVVEFDVHQTADGAWVLLHDATLDRTTDAVAKFGRKEVRVDSVTLAQVQTLDAGSWKGPQFRGEPVPTLEQALAAIYPAVPMIERKGGNARALVAELRRLEAIDKVMVQAFDWPWLTAVHEAEPKLLLGALGDGALDGERLAAAAATGARIVHWNHRSIDCDSAAAVQRAGHLLCVYTVDPDVLLLGAAAIGCDLITTNRPDRWVALRAKGARVRAAGTK
jgi:glycerophosphoryl diester phosphodiesterase